LEERKVLVPPALKTIEIEVKRIAGGLTRGKFGPSGEMEDDPQISGQVLSAGELAVVEGAISRALYKLYHNLPLLGSFERRSGKKDRRQIPRGPDRRC
jgi:hypothetical protein